MRESVAGFDEIVDKPLLGAAALRVPVEVIRRTVCGIVDVDDSMCCGSAAAARLTSPAGRVTFS